MQEPLAQDDDDYRNKLQKTEEMPEVGRGFGAVGEEAAR